MSDVLGLENLSLMSISIQGTATIERLLASNPSSSAMDVSSTAEVITSSLLDSGAMSFTGLDSFGA